MMTEPFILRHFFPKKNLPSFHLILSVFLSALVFGCGAKKDLLSNSSISSYSALTGQSSKTSTSYAIVEDLDWISLTEISDKFIQKSSRPVGYISIPKKNNRCTAFLINEDLVMTNWHCFGNASYAEGARLYLEYYKGKIRGDHLKTPSFDCGQFLFSHRALDFALLKCQGHPGKKYGFLTLESQPFLLYPGDKIYLIHQNCNYWADTNCSPTKKYSPGLVTDAGNSPHLAEEESFFHTADTLSGSSGGPIFAPDSHKVIGLHNAAPGLTSSNQGRGSKNMAIYMYKIVETLKIEFPHIKL